MGCFRSYRKPQHRFLLDLARSSFDWRSPSSSTRQYHERWKLARYLSTYRGLQALRYRIRMAILVRRSVVALLSRLGTNLFSFFSFAILPIYPFRLPHVLLFFHHALFHVTSFTFSRLSVSRIANHGLSSIHPHLLQSHLCSPTQPFGEKQY